jgi:hypothetical protein
MVAFALVLSAPAYADRVGAPPVQGGRSFTRGLRSFVRDFELKKQTLPPDAKRYRYVIVKGLLGDHFPGYLAKSMEALRRQGLEAEFAPIDTDASVAHNSAVLQEMMRATEKPIVFIGHSKGVADVTDAIGRLAKADPALVRSHVRGLVSLEGAYKGSPIADALAGSKWGLRAMKAAAFAVHGSVDAALDMRTSVRQSAIADHPMPTHLVPTVSFVGLDTNLHSRWLAPAAHYLHDRLKLRSDGIVPANSARIDGGDIAYGNVSHSTDTFAAIEEAVTLGLVGHVLERPQGSATN